MSYFLLQKNIWFQDWIVLNSSITFAFEKYNSWIWSLGSLLMVFHMTLAYTILMSETTEAFQEEPLLTLISISKSSSVNFEMRSRKMVQTSYNSEIQTILFEIGKIYDLLWVSYPLPFCEMFGNREVKCKSYLGHYKLSVQVRYVAFKILASS